MDHSFCPHPLMSWPEKPSSQPGCQLIVSIPLQETPGLPHGPESYTTFPGSRVGVRRFLQGPRLPAQLDSVPFQHIHGVTAQPVCLSGDGQFTTFTDGTFQYGSTLIERKLPLRAKACLIVKLGCWTSLAPLSLFQTTLSPLTGDRLLDI